MTNDSKFKVENNCSSVLHIMLQKPLSYCFFNKSLSILVDLSTNFKYKVNQRFNRVLTKVC